MITDTDLYRQVAFHKLFDIKLFDKNLDNTNIGVVFNYFISTLRKCKNSGRTPEAPDERTYITLIIYIINPVANLLWKIKSCKKVDNQGHGLTPQQNIDAILEYSKVTVTIKSYANAQS